jgi:serine-type D-Ala-D-Ala carboxypeptidase (penicillin-binding protein 5/6)
LPVVRRLVVVLAALALQPSAAAATPTVDARAYLVENTATGEILAQHAAGARVPIASITKLMTVLVTLEHVRLNDVVTVPRAGVGAGGSSLRLRAGERLTVRDLVKGALIQSANDAADTLAAWVGGGDVQRFVALMNAKARELHLRDTHFVRPDGLDAPGHVSSARDVLKLAQIAMHLKAVRSIVREKTDVIGGDRRLHTWNDLLGVFPGLFGVKTGHTSEAGWCEVAAVRRPGYTIYAVILGSPNRAQRNADLASLLRFGVSRYKLVSLLEPGRVYARTQIGYGRPPLALVPKRPLVRVVRVGRPLVERVVSPGAVALPVVTGQRLGRVEIWTGGKLIGMRPLVAAAPAARPGLKARVRWYGRRTIHHLWGFVS